MEFYNMLSETFLHKMSSLFIYISIQIALFMNLQIEKAVHSPREALDL